MTQYNYEKSTIHILAFYLLAGVLLTGCRKEKVLDPSNLDKNYFIIEDNANDPVDHAIYSFYKSTGIATFYNDSIYKKRVSRVGEIPERFTYVKLSLSHTPFGNPEYFHSMSLSSRTHIQSLLQLLEAEVIPKLPSAEIIPSILLIDSFSDHTIKNIQLPHGLTSIYGFNTVGIKVENMEIMSSEDRKMYAASILAGIAGNKLHERYAVRLQQGFFSISRTATKALLPMDIYSSYPLFLLLPMGSEPPPHDIGLLFYPTFDYEYGDFPMLPRESDDLRAFITAAVYYTSQEFTNLHLNDPLVQQKFQIIKRMLKDAGFRVPE